ncbi:YlxM family DNA-binding protein [Alicyclobacillus cycloheptanicus]|uniref:UPF0122 protein J2S03_003402 n=1 Tax=Alicyclobacillus cycloheptanicus TaxID=1457 RepID=A0ABT9XMI5_9BACL|nr:YlxM family DNA-binding protein [Alicyclobacillus cycloheptanicus]MDQ0191531.1 putative DNA-binding protein YlxM (UPF0122 family) [Alicyclobacillus cycloheptanicus]WDM01434.1 YlxM family DNA-binding protein [Alicyclobacillus cycloheptanicus]
MIGKVTRVGDLYDFYGALLTERQRQIVELYYFDDWSLAEIAAELCVTRQAVHDNLHRAALQLESYESALGLLEAHARQRTLVDSLCTAWHQARRHVPPEQAASMNRCVEALAREYQIETG